MILEKIVDVKKREVEQLQHEMSYKAFEQIIAHLPPTLGFQQSLLHRNRNNMGLIAEVKKASPSKGIIRTDFQPQEISRAYEIAGADCLSVLTDVAHFQGSNDDLRTVRKTVSIPLLRKDFTIHPLQIYEARAIGADAILLIAAILNKQQLKEYIEVAIDLGLDVLVEVHDRAELETVLELEIQLIGINNRDLRTFITDLKVTEQLMVHIPDHYLIVSESGISTPQHITYLQTMGVQAVLVGEHFMRQPDVTLAVNQLMGVRV
jgi:indole-3-glycerol phosphate synthase